LKEILIKSKKHGDKILFIDENHFEWFSQWTWHFGYRGYVGRVQPLDEYYMSNRGKLEKRHKIIYLHIEIAKLANIFVDGLKVDHKDRNRLNCISENLRSCTNRQNVNNMSFNPKNTSGFPGVSFDKKRNLWYSRIGINNKKKWLGYFKTAEEAFEVYKKAAIEYRGEFLNKEILNVS
jgi:hypothetical protein